MKRLFFLFMLIGCNTTYTAYRYPGTDTRNSNPSEERQDLFTLVSSFFKPQNNTEDSQGSYLNIRDLIKEAKKEDSNLKTDKKLLKTQDIEDRDIATDQVAELVWNDEKEDDILFLGMTKNEVFRFLGHPDQIDQNFTMERWAYIGSNATRQVFFKQEKVFAWIVD